jgi:FSR family fosmidomycin resistance protein-like MFS transporter
MVVDLASVATLIAAARLGGFPAVWAALLVLSYDFVAFAAQPFIGLALDRMGLAAAAAALGCVMVAAGVWLAGAMPVAAVIAAALGNALFHAGGGSLCLRLKRGSAVWAGIFVAPGAIGLFIGRQIGGTALFEPWAFTLLLALAALAGPALRMQGRQKPLAFPRVGKFGLVAAALLFTVAVRSLVGSCVSFPWAGGWQQAIWATAAVFAGKAAGGALGDKLGGRNTTVAGLVLSAPLLAFGQAVPWASMAGLFCFNMTMAVTLAGLAYMLPGHEGFAFGLTAAAIVTGMAPSTIPAWLPALGSPLMLLATVLIAAALLWAALGQLEKQIGKPKKIITGMEA